MNLSTLFKNFVFALAFLSLIEVHAQTVLSAGDIAIIGFKTNNSTDAGNDAIKLLVLRELDCNTSFIVTDNNWNRSTNSWFCENDEFAVQITVTSTILAGSIIYIEVDAAGNPVSSSTGSITKASLGNPWGSNFGLNSDGIGSANFHIISLEKSEKESQSLINIIPPFILLGHYDFNYNKYN
jgi:uncharacterized membrane protein